MIDGPTGLAKFRRNPMANESITFLCPACGIKLTILGNLAGITGPCPSCGTLIQAPYPAQYQIPPSAAHAPITTPIPVSTVRDYPSPPPVQTSSPAALRPEPRQLPTRSGHGEPVAKQMAERNHPSDSASSPLPHPKHTPGRNRFARLLLPLLFLTTIGAVVFGVLTFLNNQTKNAQSNVLKSESFVPILPESSRPPKTPQEPEQTTIPTLPVPAPEQPSITEPPQALPDALEPTTPGMVAMEVLEKFLAAKTLAERLPLIETQTPANELTNSCLAGPLPATSRIEIDAQESNNVEQVVDFYHNVDFDADDKPINPQTILVRTRGTGSPKVVVDPFLDSFGGRLAAYAKTPSDKAGVFQVTVSAVASCNDEHVPNREKKLTLKLLPRDNTKEIARAFFGRQSKIGMMLDDGTYSLSYGKAKACTVMLRWNVEDKPETPYLEAIDLKTLDWNP
jgi:hypothetical protein